MALKVKLETGLNLSPSFKTCTSLQVAFLTSQHSRLLLAAGSLILMSVQCSHNSTSVIFSLLLFDLIKEQNVTVSGENLFTL